MAFYVSGFRNVCALVKKSFQRKGVLGSLKLQLDNDNEKVAVPGKLTSFCPP